MTAAADLFAPAFRSHAGLWLPFKFEADAVTPRAWANLAAGLAGRLPPFGRVVGVPAGGLPFADALAPHADPRSALTLAVDDVLTTGGSIRRLLDAAAGPKLGLVLVARGPCPGGVWCVYQQSPWVDVPGPEAGR